MPRRELAADIHRSLQAVRIRKRLLDQPGSDIWRRTTEEAFENKIGRYLEARDLQIVLRRRAAGFP